MFAPHAKHDENIADHELHLILRNQLQNELVLELEKNGFTSKGQALWLDKTFQLL